MTRHIPNALTVGRVFLAAVFFLLLGLYQQGTAWGRGCLNAAFVVYIVAGISDVLDGYLARKWRVTSAFGRLIDPFVDKVLVVGGFTMLCGANFVLSDSAGAFERSLPGWLTGGMASAVRAARCGGRLAAPAGRRP